MPLDDIRDILKYRCKPEREFYLVRRQRWFYTFKALVCIIFRRLSITYSGEKINVAVVGGGISRDPEFGIIYWAEYLCVGDGVWSGWCCFTYMDSSA